jgi:hypothetical protein
VVAACLLVLLGILAFTLDGGLLLSERRHAQSVADAAALAAACSLYQNFATDKGLDPNATAAKNALAYAAADGYSNDGKQSTVTVNIPPTSGDYVGKVGYAEVIVQFNQPRYFSAVFGAGTIPVGARSVASSYSILPKTPGILLLNPKQSGALTLSGDGSVNVKSGAVVVDSGDSQAVQLNGNGGITTSEVDITGTGPGYQTSGNGTITTTPTPNNIKTGQDPTLDPLAYFPAPDPNSLPIRSSSTYEVQAPTVLQPGRYIGGIASSGNASIILMPGIYYLDGGGLSMSGNGSISGSGVMIYNDPKGGGTINLSGNGSLNLTAPTTGLYQGIVIFQARNAGNVPLTITGNGGSNSIGTIYAPSSPVELSGNGNANIASQFICDTMTITGNGEITVDWQGNQPPPSKDIRLVE